MPSCTAACRNETSAQGTNWWGIEFPIWYPSVYRVCCRRSPTSFLVLTHFISLQFSQHQYRFDIEIANGKRCLCASECRATGARCSQRKTMFGDPFRSLSNQIACALSHSNDNIRMPNTQNELKIDLPANIRLALASINTRREWF